MPRLKRLMKREASGELTGGGAAASRDKKMPALNLRSAGSRKQHTNF